MMAEGANPNANGVAANAESKRLGLRLAGGFLLLAAALAVAGFLYLSHRQAEARAEAHRDLSTIADLKLRQLINWREERFSDANFFSRARFVAADIRAFLVKPDSSSARAEVSNWLGLLKGGDRYPAVMVFDNRLERRLVLPTSAVEPGADAQSLLKQAVQERRVVFGDLHRHAASGSVYLHISFPVFEGADVQAGALLAVVLLELDARQFLFPLLETWPQPSHTAETLLVRQEGNDVLFLNDLRHRPGAALTLRMPMSSPDLPAAKVLRGDTRVVEGTDYRGMPVLATGRRVPGTSWRMVAKIDREEVYAPLRQQTLAVLSVLAALLVAAALFVALLWRQRTAQFTERDLAERKAHQQAMERINRLYAALSHVNQAVVRAASRDELLAEICEALVKFGGFQMTWVGWVDPETKRVLPIAQAGDNGYLQKIKVYADERLEGCGPVGTSIREGRRCVIKDIASDPTMQPWREAAAQSQWRSLASFPIRQEGRVGGALAVYAVQKDFFGEQEQELLEETADDVSFGLDTILNAQRRRQAEEQVRLQVAALQSAANAIVITNREGVVEWVNTAFERLTGYSGPEVVGQTLQMLRSDEYPEEFFEAMWQNILAGRVWHGELVNRRKDGSLYDEEMTVTPVLDTQGQVTHSVTIKQDIGQRRRAEEELRRAGDELARLNAELERKVEHRTAQLADANANLQTFTYTAAHDLRAPLRSIRSFAGLVLEESGGRLDAEGRWMLERVVASTDQMARLLSDLLDYSRIGQIDLKPEPMSLNTAVADALKLLEGEIRTKKAEVTVAGTLPKVNGHLATVVLLINNLVSNALKFVPPNLPPRVNIGAERAGDFIRLWVQDNGIGIAPQNVAQIFEPFHRLHGKGAYPGTGLGLAIVRKAAERMGGRGGVESEVGKGSRFWLELKAA